MSRWMLLGSGEIEKVVAICCNALNMRFCGSGNFRQWDGFAATTI